MFDTCTTYTIETSLGDVLLESPGAAVGDPRVVIEGDIESGVDVRRTVDSKPRRDGVILGDAYMDARVLTLHGRLIGSSSTVRIPKEEEVKAWLNRTLREDALLKFDPAGLEPMQAVCRRWEQPIIRGRVNKEVLISLVMPDPRIYTQATDTVAATVAAGPGGWTSPWTSPWGVTGGIATAATCANDGDADSPPIIDIYGPITNPVLRNTTTGKQMVFGGNAPSLSIGDGFFLRIDMDARTVQLNGSDLADRYKHVDASQSEFFELAPGDNMITLNGGGTVDGVTKAEVTWRDAYLP